MLICKSVFNVDLGFLQKIISPIEIKGSGKNSKNSLFLKLLPST